MESIDIKATDKTPAIKSDPGQGFVEIRGRSNPENAVEFYRSLIDWSLEYARNPQQKTTINIELEHFNTSSSKCLINFLKNLELIHRSEKEVLINWYYEEDDEELMEAGELFQEITGLPVTMIAT